MANILSALQQTAIPNTFDGTNIIVANDHDLNEIGYAIWYNTLSFGPQGYNISVGSSLEDMGQTITFQFPSGTIAARWQLVKSLTDQMIFPPDARGAAPVGTVGFVPVFIAFGSASNREMDPVRVVRTG
jgi:hypothetical protein